MPQDLADLGYHEISDPAFIAGGVDRPRLVLPGRNKQFEPRLFEGLWRRAEDSLQRASEVVVIGYSLPDADQRALQLVLAATNSAAKVTVCCLDDGVRICDLLRSCGFSEVEDGRCFESWLEHGGITTTA
jgi:hypothetical protein